jgi:hypothetical protein
MQMLPFGELRLLLRRVWRCPAKTGAQAIATLIATPHKNLDSILRDLRIDVTNQIREPQIKAFILNRT